MQIKRQKGEGDEALMTKSDIEKLADLACEIDYLRVRFPRPEQRAVLEACVAQLHGLAQAVGDQHGFNIYLESDE